MTARSGGSRSPRVQLRLLGVVVRMVPILDSGERIDLVDEVLLWGRSAAGPQVRTAIAAVLAALCAAREEG